LFVVPLLSLIPQPFLSLSSFVPLTDLRRLQDNETLASLGGAWIDVRDLGLAHRLALEKDAAGGERLIISAGSFKWQDWRA
jgi:nucleoside-diphosphate-sugar epimerase